MVRALPSSNDVCAAFSATQDAPEIWFLLVQTASLEAKTFDITPDDRTASDPASANVRLVRVVKDSYQETFGAAAGTVTVDSVAGSIDEFRQGAPLKARVHAGFPRLPRYASQCSGSGSAGGSNGSASCTCSDPEGNVSTCTPKSPMDDCCKEPSSDGPILDVDVAFDAHVCSEMCVGSRCDEVR
jgi:hypothetical protein